MTPKGFSIGPTQAFGIPPGTTKGQPSSFSWHYWLVSWDDILGTRTLQLGPTRPFAAEATVWDCSEHLQQDGLHWTEERDRRINARLLDTSEKGSYSHSCVSEPVGSASVLGSEIAMERINNQLVLLLRHWRLGHSHQPIGPTCYRCPCECERRRIGTFIQQISTKSAERFYRDCCQRTSRGSSTTAGDPHGRNSHHLRPSRQGP